MKRHGCSTRHLRPVAAGLSLAMLAGAATAGAAGLPAPGLRNDPDARIFPQWPAHSGTPPRATRGTVISVSNCADAGPGSLRAAVASAIDGDTVDMSALTCGVITLQTGAIAIPLDTLTLVGPGRELLAIDANATDRAFFHYGGGTFTLRDLSVRNGADVTTGFNVAGGGCIAAAGYLVLDHADVRNCLASGEGAYGGAIYAWSLCMINSSVSGNTALGANDRANTAGWGGGAFVYQLDMVNSTLSGNRATNDPDDGHTSTDLGGGAVVIRSTNITASTIADNYSYGRGGGIATLADISVINSTVSSNLALHGSGGGLFVRRPSMLDLRNSTITANQATSGGGVAIFATASQFQSSIISGNSATVGVADLYNAYTMTVSGSDNLIGTASPMITLPVDTLRVDPALAPLADNGGVTRTHALLPGSPALDGGNNTAGLGTDQRGTGFPRVYGAATDIGAFEQQQVTVAAPVAVPSAAPWISALLATLLGMFGVRGLRNH